ncbi:MAG: 2Fe-2S iron-sulfur cluster-binding protein [Chloroflexota bacterium]
MNQDQMSGKCLITVLRGGERILLEVHRGANLRRELLAASFSPYTAITQRFNCGGRGICATCGVRVVDGEPLPQHWHDRIGARFGYPRLSCQITVEHNMTVRILEEKWIWGRRDDDYRWSAEP